MTGGTHGYQHLVQASGRQGRGTYLAKRPPRWNGRGVVIRRIASSLQTRSNLRRTMFRARVEMVVRIPGRRQGRCAPPVFAAGCRRQCRGTVYALMQKPAANAGFHADSAAHHEDRARTRVHHAYLGDSAAPMARRRYRHLVGGASRSSAAKIPAHWGRGVLYGRSPPGGSAGSRSALLLLHLPRTHRRTRCGHRRGQVARLRVTARASAGHQFNGRPAVRALRRRDLVGADGRSQGEHDLRDDGRQLFESGPGHFRRLRRVRHDERKAQMVATDDRA